MAEGQGWAAELTPWGGGLLFVEVVREGLGFQITKGAWVRPPCNIPPFFLTPNAFWQGGGNMQLA